MHSSEATTLHEIADEAPDSFVPAVAGLRFIAIVAVALCHGGDTILRYRPQPGTGDGLARLAPLAATLFFVLSGFVVQLACRQAAAPSARPGFGAILRARQLRRIGNPLVLVALAFGIALGGQFLVLLLGGDGLALIERLPAYLLFVQSWVYVPLDQGALGSVASDLPGFAWPLTLDLLFYLAYPAIALLVLRLRRPIFVLAAGIGWALCWGAIASISAGASQDPSTWLNAQYGAIQGVAGAGGVSVFRWLLFFSPSLRIGEFILGCLVAQLYLQRREQAVTAVEEAVASWLVVIGLMSVAVILYLDVAQTDGAVAPFAVFRRNLGLAPSVALGLLGAARSSAGLPRLFRGNTLRALGAAADSVPLTHCLIGILILGYAGQALPATASSSLFFGARLLYFLSLIWLIGLGLHAVMAGAARSWLRESWRAGRTRRLAVTAAASGLAAGAAALCVGVQTYSLGEVRQDDSNIRLVSATYGGNCGAAPGNATTAMAAECNGFERCDYVVDATKLGDPANGCSKDFTASFACGSQAATQKIALPGEAGLGSHALAACSAQASQQTVAAVARREPGVVPSSHAGSGIDIQSATYGENCGAAIGNATADLRQICSGQAACEYSVDAVHLGDPANGCSKNFTATYQCPGGGATTRELPAEAGFGSVLKLSCQ